MRSTRRVAGLHEKSRMHAPGFFCVAARLGRAQRLTSTSLPMT